MTPLFDVAGICVHRSEEQKKSQQDQRPVEHLLSLCNGRQHEEKYEEVSFAVEEDEGEEADPVFMVRS